MNDLVSIITPCYNAENYLIQTIESVLSQSYTKWEMLIVNDCSTDNSDRIIRSYCEKEKRIRYYQTDFPSGGATLPRNIAIQHAKGRYIAFLDSDDIWLPMKLEQQIPLFTDEKTAIVYSNYEKINANGDKKNRVVKALPSACYRSLLKNTTIACLTGVYDTKKVGKIYLKKIGHEDYALWLSILKQGYIAQNTNTVTALYRQQHHSQSGNKLKAAKWVWDIYRNVENLNFWMSSYYFLNYAIRAIFKFLK